MESHFTIKRNVAKSFQILPRFHLYFKTNLIPDYSPEKIAPDVQNSRYDETHDLFVLRDHDGLHDLHGHFYHDEDGHHAVDVPDAEALRILPVLEAIHDETI